MSNSKENNQSTLHRELFALSLDPAQRTSLQSQLVERLRCMISSSANASGQKLPASRQLASELSVSRTTVQVAYEQLIAEGYLVTRRGSGTFVAPDVGHLTPPAPQPVAQPRSPRNWRPFEVGVPDPVLMPHRQFARHLDHAWRSPVPELLAQPDPFGWYPLRKTIADHLRDWRQLPCEPDQIVITSGAWEANDIIFRGVLPAHTCVAVEDPAWPRSHAALASVGACAAPVRVDNDGLDPAMVPADAQAIILTPSRHYPTGRSLPLARRLAFLEWAERRNGNLIEDDYDSEFRYRGQPLPALAGLDGLQRTIYVGSFSKLISPTIRIGYMVLPSRHVDAAKSYIAKAGARSSLIPQPALATFMESGAFAVHLRRMRRIYARRQAHLLNALSPVKDILGLETDPSGMHLFLPLLRSLNAGKTDRLIATLATERDLSISAVSSHCVLPNPVEGLLLGYAASDEEELTRAAAILIGVLSDVYNIDFLSDRQNTKTRPKPD